MPVQVLAGLVIAASAALTSSTFSAALGLFLGLTGVRLIRLLGESQPLGPKSRWSAEHSARMVTPVGQFAFPAAYLVGILAIVLIPPHGNTLFSLWTEIDGLQYVRLVTAILFVGFLPGYALMGLPRTAHGGPVSFLNAAAPACLLSVFVTTLTEWALLRFGVPLEQHVLGLLSIWVLCVLPRVLRPPHTQTPSREATVSAGWRGEAAVLVGILAVTLTAALSLNFVDRFLFFDAPVNISGGLSILRALRPLEEDHFLQRVAGAGLWYPSAFRVFLAALFQASGVPPLNAAHALDLLLLKTIPIIAFYQMARRYAGDERRVPVLATFFFFLASGFVGLAALRSGAKSIADLLSAVVRNNSSQLLAMLDQLSTQNVFIGQFPLYTQLIHAVVPMPIALTGLLVLLTLAREQRVSHVWLGTLVFAVTVVAFLFHEIEILLMLAVMYPLLILVWPPSSRQTVVVWATLAAIVFVLWLDRLSPARFFASRMEFWAGLALSGALVVVVLLRNALPLRALPACATKVRTLELAAAGALPALYVILLVWWLLDPPLAQSWITVPIRYYPAMFGLVGTLAVGEVAYRFARGVPWSRESILVAGSVPLLLALAKVAPGLSAQAAEYRLLTYPFIGMCIMAAYGLIRLGGACRHLLPPLRGPARAALVALVLISTTGGTLLALRYWRVSAAHFPYDVLRAEAPALDYLRAHRPLHRDVATVNWLSRVAVIYSGAEHNWLADLEPLFAETEPLTTLHFLDHRAIRSLYLADRDLKDLAAWGYERSFLVGHLKDYLPLAFSSPSASIYTIPPLAPAVPGSATGLLVPSSPFLLDAVALAGFLYTPYVAADRQQFAASTLITDDLSDLAIPMDDPGQWRRRWGAQVERRPGVVSLAFQGHVAPDVQSWASLRLDRFPRSRHRLLCLTYRADPLPRANAFYYFELQGLRSERLYGAPLMVPANGATRRACSPLPATLDPAWLTIAVQPAGAGPFRARLELVGVQVISASSPTWGDGYVEREWPRYLAWVRNGGRLIVAGDGRGAVGTALGLRVGASQSVDGIKRGEDRRSLPPLRASVLRPGDPMTRVTASYTRAGVAVTPLALVRRWGKGEVIYLNLSSYFEALQAARDRPRGRELFMALGALLDASSLGIPQRVAPPPSLTAIGRDVALAGDVTIRSSRLPVIQGGFRAARVTVSEPRGGAAAGRRVGGRTLSNVWIESVETAGPTDAVLTVRRLTLSPQGIGFYVAATGVDAFGWTLATPGRIMLTYRAGDSEVRRLSTTGRLVMDGVRAETPILLVRPRITVRGKTHFGYATVGWQGPHGGIAWRSWLTISGDTQFLVGHSGTYLHMPDISFSGQVTAGRVSEWWTVPVRGRHMRFSQGVRPLTTMPGRF